MEQYEKRGYLHEEFKLFHLTGQEKEVEFHYHEFDKIMIFLQGDVDYVVEGRTYHLMPYDIVLVHHHQIHRPVIRSFDSYERIIIYFSTDFISSYENSDGDLKQCFREAIKSHSNVLRVRAIEKRQLFHVISSLEYAGSHPGFANHLYCQTLFLEFMILLNRAALESSLEYLPTTRGNVKILEMLEYIHNHLREPLSMDHLSTQFYLSKYHMMRLFKQETGCTINGYINEKRLLEAKKMLALGEPVTQICYDCGFQNYSAFLRAYKKQFGESPTRRKTREKY